MISSKGMRLEQIQHIRKAWPLDDKKPLKKSVLKQLKLARKRQGQHSEMASTFQPQLVVGSQLAVTPQGMLMFAPPQQPLDLQGHPDDGEASNPQFQLLLLAPNCDGHFGEANNVQGQFDVLQEMVPIPHYQQPGPSGVNLCW